MRTLVETCRREWKRLGVPDAVADEMASDLAADLAEAEADGVSADELLGSGASDPRAFAALWAAERGVISASRDDARARRVRVAAAAFVIVAIVGAVLAIVGAPSERSASIGVISPSGDTAVWVATPPRMNAADVVTFPAPRLLDVARPSDDLRQAGLLVLVAGIGGVVLSTLFWSYSAGLARRVGVL